MKLLRWIAVFLISILAIGCLQRRAGIARALGRRLPCRHKVAGGGGAIAFFSYASMYASPRQEPPATAQAPAADRFDYLSQGSDAPFARPAPVPTMPWIDTPVNGWMAGMVIGPDGKGIDGAVVEMRPSGRSPFRRTARRTTDGNGWFGFAGVKPGRYEVRLARGPKALVEVAAGAVCRSEFHTSR